MRLTDRDIRQMQWLHEIGYVTTEQFAKKMEVSRRVANRRLQKLELSGLVERERVFWNAGHLVKLTKIGVEYIGSDIGLVKEIRLGSFRHDMQLVDLAMDLEQRHAGSAYIPERLLRHQKGLKGVGQSGHISDGHLLLGSGERVAIELELTPKQNQRLKRIVDGLRFDSHLDGVWYFCTPSVAKRVSKIAGDDPFFKITNIGSDQ